MQAGLFGGTFNPIHKGHLVVAEAVVRRFAMDRLYMIPCREPPHKSPDYLASATDRLRMIRLALPPDSRYRLCEVETRRSGPSYTIDTVNHFRRSLPPGAILFLVVGMDAFLEIHTWKRFRRLLEAVQPVVVTRSTGERILSGDPVGRLDAYIRSRLSGGYQYVQKQTRWYLTGKNPIHLLPIPPVDISSSQVRRRIRDGQPIAELVPAAVNAYIEAKELYR